MDLNELVTIVNYQKLAERTSATAGGQGREKCVRRVDQWVIRLLHAAMGMGTEAGEFQDAIKKHVFYGAEIDVVNLQEECGDMLWYLAEAMNALGISMDEVMRRNIRKLKTRYPDAYSDELAENRNLAAERRDLEDSMEGVA